MRCLAACNNTRRVAWVAVEREALIRQFSTRPVEVTMLGGGVTQAWAVSHKIRWVSGNCVKNSSHSTHHRMSIQETSLHARVGGRTRGRRGGGGGVTLHGKDTQNKMGEKNCVKNSSHSTHSQNGAFKMAVMHMNGDCHATPHLRDSKTLNKEGT